LTYQISTCEVCTYVFNDISTGDKYLHALMTHIKILHKALQWSDCNDCKAISSDVAEDMLTDQKISDMTLKKIKEHIKVLHRSEKSK